MLRLVLKTSCVTVFDHTAQQVCVCMGVGGCTPHWRPLGPIPHPVFPPTGLYDEYKYLTRKNCFRYLKLMFPLNAAICTTISCKL
jgi:hypothetical protein